MSFLTSLRPSPSTSTTRVLSSLLHRPTQYQQARHLARMTIVGRLADTPEKVATASSQTVIRYALATNNGPRDNRQTSWWKVACFAPSEKFEEVLMGLGKGSMLCVEGECSMNKFTAKDGSQQNSLNIVQRNIEILEKRGDMMEGEELQAATG